MSYAGDERRFKSGSTYRKVTKKRPSATIPPPNWGNTFTIATSGAPPTDFWNHNPIPQTGLPLVPTTSGDAVNSILASDAGYQALLASLNAEGVADRASRDAAIRRSLVMFGEVPNVPSGFLSGEDVSSLSHIADPTTRSLASQNTTAGMSIVARLAQAAKDAQRNTVNNLGARGMFRSGETGFQLGRVQLSADQARFDATAKLLDYVAGVQAAYVQNERARQQAIAQAAGQTISTYDPPPNPTPVPYVPPSAPPPAFNPQTVVNAMFPPKPSATRKPPPRYNPPGFIGGV